jgi:hypothetical protein
MDREVAIRLALADVNDAIERALQSLQEADAERQTWRCVWRSSASANFLLASESQSSPCYIQNETLSSERLDRKVIGLPRPAPNTRPRSRRVEQRVGSAP